MPSPSSPSSAEQAEATAAPSCSGTTAGEGGAPPSSPSPCLLASARAFWALWRATEGSAGSACGGEALASTSASAARAASAPPPPPPLRATAADGGARLAAASAAEPSTTKSAHLEERYGTPTSHTSLAKSEVEQLVDDALSNSTPVRYLLDSLQRGGCGVGRAFFHVAKCEGDVHGGFSTEFGVVLCHNRLQHAREVELALAHELVHAYDFCRAKDLDLRDCRHHACTEVRAAALSGDCGFAQELLRGNLSESIVGQYRRCVKRRAAMSVAMNPHCSAPGQAEAAVAAVLPQCFRDTDPWPRIPALD